MHFNHKEMSYLFNLIRAIPLRPVATMASDESTDMVEGDPITQVSARAMRGSIILSNSCILSNTYDRLEFVCRALLSSMMN